MTETERELLAAEYVLGTLDAGARERVAVDVDNDTRLAGLVDAWERRLHRLDVPIEAAEPPAGLWNRIDAGLGAPAPLEQGSVTLRADEGAWIPVVEGVEKKVLLVDVVLGEESFLLRFASGAHLPPHDHRIVEECLLLEGDLNIGGVDLRAGDYHAVHAGTDHPVIYSNDGAVMYVRGEIRDAA